MLDEGVLLRLIDGTDATTGSATQASGMTLNNCSFTGNLTAVNKPVDGFALSGTSSLFSQIRGSNLAHVQN